MLATGSTTDLRRHNRDMVLRAIKTRGVASRTEIADRVGLTNAAVSRIVREVIDAGLVEEGGPVIAKGQAGRRQVALRLAEQGAYVLGIAVTLNAREVVIGNGQGEIINRMDCTDISLDHPLKALRKFARRASSLIERASIDRRRLLGGAASVAGRVDPADGRIIGADPLDWDGQQVAATFEHLLGIPFISEGRAAALLKLEHSQGHAAGLNDILLINVGLRLGTALMVDGHLLRGTANDAFVLGRYKLTPGTALDDAASGASILSRLEAYGKPMPKDCDPGSYLRQIINQDTKLSGPEGQAFRKSGQALGRAILALAPVLAPQQIILAGLVVRQPAYLEGVQSTLLDSNLQLQATRSTTAQSAIELALDHHLFNEKLNLSRLIAA